MADPTVPWGIPLFDDNTPFAPIQAPFNTQSAALNDALSSGSFMPYATKALLDTAPGTRVGQHASVYADGTVANNGDYRWSGTVWIQTWGSASGLPFRMSAGVTVAKVTSPSSPEVLTVVFPAGRFTVPPVVTAVNAISDVGVDPIGLISIHLISATQMSLKYVVPGPNAQIVAANWTAVQMTPTSAAG